MPLLIKGDVTVHKLLPGVSPEDQDAAYEAVTLDYGDTLEENEVPKYVLDKVKAGEVERIELGTRAAAEKFAKEVAEKKADAESLMVNASNADEDADKA